MFSEAVLRRRLERSGSPPKRALRSPSRKPMDWNNALARRRQQFEAFKRDHPASKDNPLNTNSIDRQRKIIEQYKVMQHYDEMGRRGKAASAR